MQKHSELYTKVILVGADIFALLLAFTIAYVLRVTFDPRPIHVEVSAMDFIWSIFTILPLWIILFSFLGLYTPHIYTHPVRNAGRFVLAAILGAMFMISFSFFTKTPLFPTRLVAFYAVITSFITLFTLRTLINLGRLYLLQKNIGIKKIAIVGNSDMTTQLALFIKDNPSTGFRVTAIVSRTAYIPPSLKHLHCRSVKSAALRNPLDAILKTDDEKSGELYEFAARHYIDFYQLPVMNGLFTAPHSIEIINSTPVVYIKQTPLHGFGQVVKRAMDIVGSGIGIIITAPIMLTVAILVKIGDPEGTILMHGKQRRRLTRYNKPFNVYKFRSHYARFDGKTDEEVFEMIGKPELIDEYRKNGDKLDNDFRVTPVGKFIRRFSLDELPQLFNVFKGDISLVGPRALVPHELELYNKKHAILSVKSGLTGLAVVSGRRNISFEERRKLDLYYVQNWSVWLDIRILFKTVFVIFSKNQ